MSFLELDNMFSAEDIRGLDAMAAVSAPSQVEPPCADAPYLMSAAEAAEVAKLSKNILNLGVLGGIKTLQDRWDGEVPAEMPYDPFVYDANGKQPETLESFCSKTKGRVQPISITSSAMCCVPVLESLARVIEQFGLSVEDPLATLWGKLVDPNTASARCTDEDRSVVLQMIALRLWRVKNKATGGDVYCGWDIATLKFLQKCRIASRLDKQGVVVAQLFVDFLRGIGEYAAIFAWEKKAVLDEFMFRTILRILPAKTGVPLSEDTLSDLWTRRPAGKK